MSSFQSLLNRPEYVHCLINHFPLIGLFAALLALTAALFLKDQGAIKLGLALVFAFAVSVWPVSEFGEQGFDRVLSMADDDGQAFLRYHSMLAERWTWLFYVTAGLAALGLGLAWKWPQASRMLSIGALVAGLASLVAGLAIARAGGEVRHREFRSGPPPAIRESSSVRGVGGAPYMWAMILSPNSEHLISVAPCMRRAKS